MKPVFQQHLIIICSIFLLHAARYDTFYCNDVKKEWDITAR